jgi:D-glycero-D-manno-heptose 1,7-bisphosphate phosphatase
MTLKRYIFLDRDGTLNEEKDYLGDPDQLFLYPKVGKALYQLQEKGFGLIVVTNQSGIGRGYFTGETVQLIHQKLIDLLAIESVKLDAIYLCPHHPDFDCDCRKPKMGMITQAQKDFHFVPKQCFVIGDKAADINLAKTMGAFSILVRTGWGAQTEKAQNCSPDVIVDTILQAIPWIMARSV